MLGKPIVKVNGLPALEFFEILSRKTCVYKDVGVCFNNLMGHDIFPLLHEMRKDGKFKHLLLIACTFIYIYIYTFLIIYTKEFFKK